MSLDRPPPFRRRSRLPSSTFVTLSRFYFTALCFALATTFVQGASHNVDSLVRDALAAEARFDSATALELFRRADQAHPEDPFILEKISRQLSDLSEDAPTPELKKQLCTEALAFAVRAAAIDPRSAVNLLSVGVCHGKLALLSGTREKIERSRLMRDFAERAIAANPNYHYAHHVLGRWHYEVATLGAGKRFLVNLVYGGLPDASTTEAIRHLRLAIQLAPEFPAHHVEPGFALRADGQPDAALASFAHALTLPPRDKYDIAALARARAALGR